MIDLKYVGQNIRWHRKRRKKSQAWLASQLHVSQRLISYWETGQRCPAPYGLTCIARVLGVLEEELIQEPKKLMK